MKNYDFEKAVEIIDSQKANIETAELGMHEDWMWTAETVFEDNEYTTDLSKQDLTIGGISGSSWATPTLHVVFKDGSEKMLPCYSGESSQSGPPFPIVGVLSGPVQNSLPPLEYDRDGENE